MPNRRRTITLTRPHPLNDALIAPLESAGWQVRICPLVEIIEPSAPMATQMALQQLASNDIILACSPTAVIWAAAYLHQQELSFPQNCDYVAIGSGTARTLHTHGIEQVWYPLDKNDALSTLALPVLRSVLGLQIACLQGENPKIATARILQKRGAHAHAIDCYRRQTPIISWADLLNSEAILISSSSMLKEFYRNSSKMSKCSLKYPYILVHHAEVYRLAKQWGLRTYLLPHLDAHSLLQALAEMPLIYSS